PTAGMPRFDRRGFHPRGENGPTMGFNRPTHRVPTTTTAEIPLAPHDFSHRPGRFGSTSGFGGRREFEGPASPGASSASSSGTSYHAPRSTPGGQSRSAPAPRETTQRSQPAETPRAQPQSNAHVEKSA